MLSRGYVKTLCLGLFVLIVLCLSLAIFASIYFGQSDISPEMTYDAGYVCAGRVLEYEFPIVNRSRNPLRILDIKASCSCILPKEKTHTIAPKTTYEFPMSVRTEGRSGPYSAVALIMLEDGREIRCAVNCHIVSGYPKEVLFAKVMKGEEAQKEFYLQNIAEQKVDIKDITYSHEHFDIQWEEHRMADANISGHRINVSLKDTLPYGPFYEWIIIETDDSLEPEKRVNIRGYVLQPIECDRTRLAMGMIKSDSRKSEKIRIFSPYNKPFEIAKVESAKGNCCQWYLEKLDDNSYELEVAVEAKDHKAGEIISEEISIYGVVEQNQVRQDIHILAMVEK